MTQHDAARVSGEPPLVYSTPTPGSVPLHAAANAPAAQEVNAKYKIALLVPLTGKSAEIGKSISDAAQMAVFESGNRDFQLMPIDTGDDIASASAATDKAIAGGASIILGPVFSDKVERVGAKARQAGLKVIAFSNNKAVAGDNVYILGAVPDQQVARVLKYASERGVKGFSAILPINVFGNQTGDYMRNILPSLGGELRKISTYAGGDLYSAARSISVAYNEKSMVPDRNGEAVLIPEGGAKAGAAAQALKKNSLGNIRLLGTALWDNAATIQAQGLDGAWFASAPYEGFDDFSAHFVSSFGNRPEDIAALGYDAVKLAMEIAPEEFSDSEIHRSKGFNGVKGIYRFDKNNVSQRGYAIYEIQNGVAHVADPAPERF